jgi:hypothetical protein
MSVNFAVFSVDSGVLRSIRPVPDYFHRAAFNAYSAIRNSGNEVDQSRIVELVAACFQMLENRGVSEPHTPQPALLQEAIPNDADYPGDVEVLAGLLGEYDHDAKRFAWASAAPNGEGLGSSQMMAAYAFQRIDSAAASYLAGQSELAMQMLAEACSATANYGFHRGFDDHITMLKEDAAQAADKGWAPLREVRAHAVTLWRDGGKSKWKSMRSCSIEITQEILLLAIAKGRKMEPDNAQRTIYEWLRASEKHTE